MPRKSYLELVNDSTGFYFTLRKLFALCMRSVKSVGLISVDQALSSLSNLVASIIAAHALEPADFGVFGIIFAIYLLAIDSVRAITGETLLLAGAQRAKEAAAINLVVSAAFGLLIGMVVLAGSYFVDGALATGLAILGFGLAGLTVQDTIRYIGFAAKQIHLSLIADSLWLAFMAVASLLTATGETASLARVAGTWIFTGCAAALCTLPFVRVHGPIFTRLTLWLREKRVMMASLLIDRGIVSATQQSVIFIIAILIGLEGNAAYRGAQIVMGPINVFAMGISTAMIPHFVGIWQERPEALHREAIKFSVLGGFSILAISQAAAWMPDQIGRALVGQSWQLSQPILHAMALIIPLQISNFAALGALRAMGRVRGALVVRVIVAPSTVLAIAVAAYFGSISAVVWTQAVCTALAAVVWWSVTKKNHQLGLKELIVSKSASVDSGK
ncbi:hypothetical protein KNJ79_06605 [Sphingopyxis indica]|uniref:hypothetical protein n=1 Tax=Sphingopyxis indica TaxID=436663 RepID=UPI0029392D84|nr:hypothetical protein [Sphingopyxis indica]WOF44586.1 hypothetical protein KNJ79_06605 [Sphingopyxis indica]